MFDALDQGGTGRLTQQDLRAGLQKAQILSPVSCLAVCNILTCFYCAMYDHACALGTAVDTVS